MGAARVTMWKNTDGVCKFHNPLTWMANGFCCPWPHLTYDGYLTIEMITDTADPRRVPEAFPIMSLKYDEAMELAYFGAQVYAGTSHSSASRILPRCYIEFRVIPGASPFGNAPVHRR